MPFSHSPTKIGVYVDVSNLSLNGGFQLQYGVLRAFACRDGAQPQRLNAYVSFDAERARHDAAYRSKTEGFHAMLRDLGFKIIIKEVRWYEGDAGRTAKSNADLDLAVDALLQSEHLDRVLLCTGDGDFVRLVKALQDRGCRVEVLGLDNVSVDLRQEADLYLSGYLVPNLIPMERDENEEAPPWGAIGSRVRGWCYWHNHTYGFFRFLKCIAPNLWDMDARQPDSPYQTAFFHDSNLSAAVRAAIQPSRTRIFEFTLIEAERGLQAVDVSLAGGQAGSFSETGEPKA
ncbi:MAG: NYN domain-containing protein [Chloroflexota bacterium]